MSRKLRRLSHFGSQYRSDIPFKIEVWPKGIQPMDRVTKAKRSEMMSNVRTKGTKPELMVRSLLHRLGFRFRLHRKDLPGKPDVVLPKYKTVVFVHGCCWHSHSCPKGQKRPEQNKDFGNKKIEDNVARDQRHREELEANGWTVLTIWDCELKDLESVRLRLLTIRKPE